MLWRGGGAFTFEHLSMLHAMRHVCMLCHALINALPDGMTSTTTLPGGRHGTTSKSNVERLKPQRLNAGRVRPSSDVTSAHGSLQQMRLATRWYRAAVDIVYH